jgi:hypothetical protein
LSSCRDKQGGLQEDNREVYAFYADLHEMSLPQAALVSRD